MLTWLPSALPPSPWSLSLIISAQKKCSARGGRRERLMEEEEEEEEEQEQEQEAGFKP